MTRLALALAPALVLALAPALAAAQPTPEPETPETPVPDKPEPQPEPQPQPQPQPPTEPAPDPQLQRAYDDAFGELLRGKMATAIAGFDSVASRATGNLAASARELGRLARQLQAKRIRFVVATTPAGTPATVTTEIAADDQKNSGRIGFVAYSTLAGIYTGITLAVIADVDDFRAATLLVVGGTGASFLASMVGSRDRDISSGMADSYATGLLVGAGNGLLLSSPLGLDDADEIFGAGLAGLAVGGVASLAIADRTRPTVGQSTFVSTLGIMGFATTGLGMIVVGDDNIDEDLALTVLAGGLDAGTIAGIIVAPDLKWSRGRARLVQLGSLLGGLAGLGIAAIIAGDPETDGEARLLAGSTLAGMWGGFGLAVKLTDEMAPDPRFTAPTPIAVMPSMIRDAPALVVGGSF